MWRKKSSKGGAICIYLFSNFIRNQTFSVEDLKYPIGQFSFDTASDSNQKNEWIQQIETLPIRLVDAIINLSGKQLNIPYRENGWTIRQVIHHLADSHLNAFIRTKLLLTENEPTIKPFDEKLWANLSDNNLSIEPSLQIIKGVHTRWAHILKSVDIEDWDRILNHPESGPMSLSKLTALYAWHGNHHLAHITSLKKRKNWQ